MATPGDTADRWVLLGASVAAGLFALLLLYAGETFASLVDHSASVATPSPSPTVWLLRVVGGTLLVVAGVGSAVAVDRDSRFLAPVSGWEPLRRSWVPAAAAFPLSLGVVAAYLWRRRNRVGWHPAGRPTVADLRASRLPALLVSLPLLVPLVGVALPLVAPTADVLLATTVLMVGLVLAVLGYLTFLVAIGLDAGWVRASDLDWDPSRARYSYPFAVAAVVPVVFPLVALVAGLGYVYTRRRRLRA